MSTEIPEPTSFSDYFAEMYVAGRLADAGWNIYFPRRDKGFDFIATKVVRERMLIRPVQVKGKYPSVGKGMKPTYGYLGKLSQTHPDMVLAIPYFLAAEPGHEAACAFVAYMPNATIRKKADGVRYSCMPASFDGKPLIRRDHAMFFGSSGIGLMEREDWATISLESAREQS